MVVKSSLSRKIIAFAVCVAMVCTLSFAFQPTRASAASDVIKQVAVEGIGNVLYVELDAEQQKQIHSDDPGEWYHYHVNVNGVSGVSNGQKDFRVMSDSKKVAYYAVDYPALPGRNSADQPVEVSPDGLGFKLYGTSKISNFDFWKGEGLTASTLTDESSPVKDDEGYYDLGGFDTVSRATLGYGIGHTAYVHENVLTGFKAKAVDESTFDYVEDGSGDPIPAGPFVPTFRSADFNSSSSYKVLGFPTFRKGPDTTKTTSGHAAAEVFYTDTGDGSGEQVYYLDKYELPGFSDLPVSANAMDYVEMMVLDDIGEEVPDAFENIKVGGELVNIWDGDAANPVNSKQVIVDENTGLLKHINRAGNYGKAAPGKNELETEGYDFTSNTVGDDYNTKWGDYYDALLTFKIDNDNKITTTAIAQYSNYAKNCVGAKYEYYGDVEDISGIDEKSDIANLSDLGGKVDLSKPKAAYGTLHASDWWFRPANKNPRLELGFNFDSIRLGGSGDLTSVNGVVNYGAAKDKTGFYRVTLYALGHENIETLVYVKSQYENKPSLAVSDDLETLTLKNLDADLKTAIENGEVEVALNKAAVTHRGESATITDEAAATCLFSKGDFDASTNSYDISKGLKYTGADEEGHKAGDMCEVKVDTTYTVSLTSKIGTYVSFSLPLKTTYATDVSLPESLRLMRGESSTLGATIEPTEATMGTNVTWESSDQSVATVDASGKVTAISAGTATITATIPSSDTAECTVTVTLPQYTVSFEANGGSAVAAKRYAEGTALGTLPMSTRTGYILSGWFTAPTGGTRITAATVVNGNATYYAQWEQKTAASIKLSAAKMTLYHKGSKSKTTLTATVTGDSDSVAWTSSNTKVATVKNGIVTAKAKGTTTITATANGVSAKTVITVKNATLTLKKASASIKKGKKYTIKATATPKVKITYKTSNKKVATVTAKGVVKGKKKGKATITVTANGISKKFKITVK